MACTPNVRSSLSWIWQVATSSKRESLICKKLNIFIDVISLQSFSRAVHLCPDNEELRFEDLSWAHDLLLREKLGNREWKPIKDPEPKGEDSDEEYMIEEDGERTKILPTSFRS